MRTCELPGCEERHVAQGYCRHHYDSAYRLGDPNAAQVSVITHTMRSDEELDAIAERVDKAARPLVMLALMYLVSNPDAESGNHDHRRQYAS